MERYVLHKGFLKRIFRDTILWNIQNGVKHNKLGVSMKQSNLISDMLDLKSLESNSLFISTTQYTTVLIYPLRFLSNIVSLNPIPRTRLSSMGNYSSEGGHCKWCNWDQECWRGSNSWISSMCFSTLCMLQRVEVKVILKSPLKTLTIS